MQDKKQIDMTFQEFLDYFNPVPDSAVYIMGHDYNTNHLNHRKNHYFYLNDLAGLENHAMVQRMALYQTLWARYPQHFWTVTSETRELDAFLHADTGAVDLYDSPLPNTAYEFDGIDQPQTDNMCFVDLDGDGIPDGLTWEKRYTFKSGMVREPNVIGFILTAKSVDLDEEVTVTGYDYEVDSLVLKG